MLAKLEDINLRVVAMKHRFGSKLQRRSQCEDNKSNNVYHQKPSSYLGYLPWQTHAGNSVLLDQQH